MQKLQKNKILVIQFAALFVVGAMAIYKHYPRTTEIELPDLQATSSELQPSLPNFAKYTDVKQKKQAFVDFMYPIIVEENSQVLALREALIKLQAKGSSNLDERQQQWLNAMAKRYRISNTTDSATQISQLLTRVDFIPPALALTQAAIESGWGSSRFAKQGNNLFGQWCFSKGCGMVPMSRDADRSHEVAKFESVNHAIRAYIHNLNTNQSYQSLRDKRAQLRAEQLPVTGKPLAQTLLSYSEQGALYIDKLTSVMRQNKFESYAQSPLGKANAD